MIKDLISIIVPVYKVEEYLPRCIESILKQSYTNIEIILVDDGSPDRCGEICEEYALKDHRIKVIHKLNGGLSDARNVGLEAATGEFIGFVDSDDYIHKDMYFILYEAMVKQQCEIAESGVLQVYDTVDVNYPLNNGITKIFNKKEAVINAIMEHKLDNYVWNKLFRRELWANIQFPVGKIFEDAYTTYKIINNTSKVVKVQSDLYFYFQRSDSIANSIFTEKKLDHCDALEGMMNFICKKYPEMVHIVSIKYFYVHFIYLLRIINNKKNIKDYQQLIKKLRNNMIKNGRYLKEKPNMRLFDELLKSDYSYYLSLRKKMLIGLWLLNHSTWLFYLLIFTFQRTKSQRPSVN